MKILITGAAGQDGIILAKKLVSQGNQVMGIVRNSNSRIYAGQNLEGLRVQSRDLSDEVICHEVLDSFDPSVIFHLAAVHTNSDGMDRLGMTSARKMHSCHVKIATNVMTWQVKNLESKLIVALSSQMYTASEVLRQISENDLPNPASIYGITKFAAWQEIKAFRTHHKIWAAGAILFNHSSELSKLGYLFPILAEQLARQFEDPNLGIEVRAPGAIVDFTSAYDVCEGLIKMTQRNTPEDFVFASGRPMTIADIVNEAQLILDLPKTRFQNVESVSGGLVGNITKARDSLDWAPTASPAEVLVQMTEALRKSKNV